MRKILHTLNDSLKILSLLRQSTLSRRINIFWSLLFTPFFTCANEVIITAEYKPDPANSGRMTFVDTTPNAGICKVYCPPGEVAAPLFNGTLEKNLDSSATDKKNMVYASLDGTPRKVKLISTENPAHQFDINFRISAIHKIYSGPSNAEEFNRAIRSDVVNGGCSIMYKHDDAMGVIILGWRLPRNISECHSTFNERFYYNEIVKILHLAVGYEINVPAGTPVRDGYYQGEVIYKVGNASGAGMIGFGETDYNGLSEIRLNINIKVEQAFNYYFAPGTEKVTLEPRGGWDQWVNGGRIPVGLHKDVPFTLSSASGFRIRMFCPDAPPGDLTCSLQGNNQKIPLDVSMTLPGFTHAGQPVRNIPLTTGMHGLIIDPPLRFVKDQRSVVHFQVNKEATKAMLQHPGQRYQGAVTLLFEAQTE